MVLRTPRPANSLPLTLNARRGNPQGAFNREIAELSAGTDKLR
jgi:hypothetical protein